MKKESNTIVLNTTKKTRRRNNTTHYERLIALLQLIWEGKGHKRTHLARRLVVYIISTIETLTNAAKIFFGHTVEESQ